LSFLNPSRVDLPERSRNETVLRRRPIACSALDVSAINQLTGHDTFDGSAFYKVFEKVLCLALTFRFRFWVYELWV